MSKKTIGVLLIVLGVVLLVISIAADTLGIGTGNGFGWKQLSGTVVGVVLALGGVWLAMRKPDQKK
jgi:hypothetical protein